MNRGMKIRAGQRSPSMALAKWIAASGDENAFHTANSFASAQAMETLSKSAAKIRRIGNKIFLD